jgi:hypothetical protein
MDDALDAVVEVFSWVGLGLGALLAGVALLMYVFDGTWLPARGVLEDSEHGRLVRWFDEDGTVNQAHLSHEQEHALIGKNMADIFYRRGSVGRMRLSHGSPAVRLVVLLAAGLIGLGVAALILSWVLLFARG